MDDLHAVRLREIGLRVTAPRLAVLRALEQARSHGRHLRAAEVGEAVRIELGSVSTQAVYDCLDALRGAGLVRRIEPAGHAALYETRVGDNHHHMVCRGCGLTLDVDCVHGEAPCLSPSEGHGFVLDEAEVIFWGLCATCAAPPSDLLVSTTHTERTS
ncbi:Fur family transcriptional regulator [Cellulomonas bogoriensis]|nr:Fur family transcriptional regulator [Cellulomonas bogoriensis]